MSTLFTAAVVTDTNVRDILLQGIWNRANSNTTIGAFMDTYNNDGAGVIATSGAAGYVVAQAGNPPVTLKLTANRSAVGSMFSLLALK